MNINKTIRSICYNAIICALYVILVFIFSFISYESIQIRIAEVLIFLVLINKKYIYGITLGCFIANLIGPYGIIDACVGGLATMLCCILLILTKKAWMGILILPICNILVGIELSLITSLDLIPSLIMTSFIVLGELITAIIGVLLFYLIKKNNNIINLLEKI